MVALSPNHADLEAPRKEFLFSAPAALLPAWRKLMRDERDEPMLHLMWNILTTTLPVAFALLFALPGSHILGAAYFFINAATYLQRFVLWMHFSAHRPTYRAESWMGSMLNQLAQYIIAPFFGIPSGMYHLHHVVMHHNENNLFPYDVSSTEPYQRDNFLHFLHYWARFTFAGWFELPYYAITKGRYDLFRSAVTAEAVWFYTVYACYRMNPVATTWVFIVPHVFTSFALMFGNWSQHIFIAPDNSRSNHCLTVNCINTPHNQKTFNDGYHILHHCNSRTHWTELPGKFAQRETLEKHAAEDAIVLDGLWFDDVGALCFLGMYENIAKRMVQWPDILGDDSKYKKRTTAEIVEMLKLRLKPIVHAQQPKSLWNPTKKVY